MALKSSLETDTREVMKAHGWKRGSGSSDDLLLAKLDKAFDEYEAELELQETYPGMSNQEILKKENDRWLQNKQ